MPSLLDKASNLDKRVLGRTGTPEEWRRNARRWWWSLAAAGLVLLVSMLRVAESTELGSWWALVLTLPTAALSLWLAFLGGLWRAEHDRLQGKDRVLGTRRPEGL